MNKPLNLIKLKHQLNGLKSLRVSEQYVTSTSRFTMAQPAASPFGGSHFLVSFAYKGKLVWLGEGQREESNSIYPGNCSCYCKWPRRAHYKLLCEAVSPWSACHVASPQPGPPGAPAPPFRVGQQSRGVEEGQEATFPDSFRESLGRGRSREAPAPSTSLPRCTRGGGGARVLRRLQNLQNTALFSEYRQNWAPFLSCWSPTTLCAPRKQ